MIDLSEAIAEFQAGLPEEDRPARREADMCLSSNEKFFCTKPRGHKGEHIAHGLYDISARWEN